MHRAREQNALFYNYTLHTADRVCTGKVFSRKLGRQAEVLDRKGFVRIALESGTPLVPVYHFGNSKLFSWVAPRWLEFVSRRLRVAVGYPMGRWRTLMPCNAPLMMAVGSPIPVPHIAPGQPGFNEAVDAAHEQLVNALVELYYKYRGLYGWHDRPLVVN